MICCRTPSQLPVAQQATNWRCRSPWRSSRCAEHVRLLWVELEPLAGELLQHVVRDDDGWFAGQAQAPWLRNADDHFGCFPGADFVGEQHRGLMDHPGDGGDLVAARPEGHRESWQRQVHVVVAAQNEAVELLVVGAGQVCRPGRFFPGPCGEAFRQLGGLLLGCQGGVEVQDGAFAVQGAYEVADLDLALFQDGLGELARDSARFPRIPDIEEKIMQCEGRV